MRVLVALLLALLVPPPGGLHAKKNKTNLRVVVQDGAGDPVPRASVIVRILKGKKHKKIGHSFELRTSQQGTAPLPPLRQGYVLIQVIAKGYQTFGGKVELRELDQTVTVTMKPPQQQHTVHTGKKEQVSRR